MTAVVERNDHKKVMKINFSNLLKLSCERNGRQDLPRIRTEAITAQIMVRFRMK